MSKKNRMKRTIRTSDGNACPKCRKKMGRFAHGPTWRPKNGQPYYFEYWDKCAACSHIQHYEYAKVTLVVSESAEHLDAEYREAMRT